MTTAQIVALIDQKIKSGGRQTTAALLRSVLSEMANDNDAIIALQALSLIAFESNTSRGLPLGKSLYVSGFNSNPANHSFLKIFNTTQGFPWFIWMDDSGILRAKNSLPSSVSDGSFIQLSGAETTPSQTLITVSYSNYLGVTGTTPVVRMDTAIKSAYSGSFFPAGWEITIEWAGNFSLTHNAAPSGSGRGFFMKSGADFAGVIGDVKTFKYNGTIWKEI